MTITVGIVIFVIIDLVIVTTVVVTAVRMTWGPYADRYPARTPAPDAVRRNFQSFRFGIVNMGGCVHVAVDEGHLHLVPARVLRWLGAVPLSVPWSSITVKRRSRSGTWIDATINGHTVKGPAWCLELAETNE